MENVIILKDNKYTIIDSKTAKDRNLQIVYSHPRIDNQATIYLENGLRITHKFILYKEKGRFYIFVYAGGRFVDRRYNDSISDICYLANKYNTISMTDIIKLLVDKSDRHEDSRTERILDQSKKEILELSRQLKELKKITTNEFRNTNCKVCKKR
ncbi:MAG: hypothetical protein WBG43_03390 [Marinifilaceae bacterium]